MGLTLTREKIPDGRPLTPESKALPQNPLVITSAAGYVV